GEAYPCSRRAEARRRLKPAPRFLRLFGILLGIVLAAVCGFAAEPNLSFEDRKFIETHFQTARSAEAAQQYDQAAREYEIILKKYPTLVPDVYQNLGIVYYYRQKYEDA